MKEEPMSPCDFCRRNDYGWQYCSINRDKFMAKMTGCRYRLGITDTEPTHDWVLPIFMFIIIVLCLFAFH